MSQSNYPLRLQTSLLKAVRKIATEEGTSVNTFINVAVAEKLSALRTADLFRGRLGPEERERALAILASVGGEPPREGDEIPDPGDIDKIMSGVVVATEGERRSALARLRRRKRERTKAKS